MPHAAALRWRRAADACKALGTIQSGALSLMNKKYSIAGISIQLGYLDNPTSLTSGTSSRVRNNGSGRGTLVTSRDRPLASVLASRTFSASELRSNCKLMSCMHVDPVQQARSHSAYECHSRLH